MEEEYKTEGLKRQRSVSHCQQVVLVCATYSQGRHTIANTLLNQIQDYRQ